MLGLVIAVVLSAHGDEPTVVQTPDQVRGVANPAFVTPAAELQYLKKNRPTLEWAAAVLGVGVVITGVGALLMTLVFTTAASCAGRVLCEGPGYIVLVAAPVLGLGAAVGIGGGIAMGVIGGEMTRVDARIRLLEAQLAAPTSIRIPIIPPVVLARF